MKLVGLASLFIPIAVFSACRGETAGPALVTESSISLVTPASVIESAVNGTGHRGEQDVMLRLEAQLPGFGGFFRDSSGAVVAYLKSGSATSPAAIRSLLAATYSHHANPAVRDAMSTAASAEIRPSKFSLSELVALEETVAHSRIPIPGFSGAGVSVSSNRVMIGFEDEAAMAKGVEILQALHLPVDAFIPEVWGAWHLATTFHSTIRPTRGGIDISVHNRTRCPRGDTTVVYLGSIGFNVATNGLAYTMVSGHMLNYFCRTIGVTGDTINQPEFTPINFSPIATVSYNPAWRQGANCRINSNTGTNYDFCTQGDVGLATNLVGVFPERKIAVGNEGQNGAAGSQTINGYYSIGNVLPPDLVPAGVGVHKSGARTGTTTGALVVANFDLPVQVCWYVTPCAPAQMQWIDFEDATRVNHVASGEGDSGASVFAGNGSPYSALGILIAGNAPDICVNSTACSFGFHKWSNLENTLGLGPLTVTTP